MFRQVSHLSGRGASRPPDHQEIVHNDLAVTFKRKVRVRVRVWVCTYIYIYICIYIYRGICLSVYLPISMNLNIIHTPSRRVRGLSQRQIERMPKKRWCQEDAPL